MSLLFPLARSLLYGAAFVLLWGYLALTVERFDSSLGITLPAAARWAGVLFLALGGALALACLAVFAVRGAGTPAPFDPPRNFVAVGPYRWVRNPMYIGGLLALTGFALWRASPSILVLAAVFLLAAHLFVVFFEEPQLERRFGSSYAEYRARVNRWAPRPPEPAR